jgi:hypothetical protein
MIYLNIIKSIELYKNHQTKKYLEFVSYFILYNSTIETNYFEINKILKTLTTTELSVPFTF